MMMMRKLWKGFEECKMASRPQLTFFPLSLLQMFTSTSVFPAKTRIGNLFLCEKILAFFRPRYIEVRVGPYLFIMFSPPKISYTF